MEKKRYGKLVRDKIPDIIRGNKEMPMTRTMETDEYRRELLYKLIEEAEEVRQAGYESDSAELMSELSDVMEVYLAILTEYNLNADEIEKLRLERAEKRGGFKDKIFLESVSS